MQIFDAPTREKCTVQRSRTNTPLQALVTLNDVQFVEAARNFAERMITQPANSDSERLQQAFRWTTSRWPTEQETEVLSQILNDARETYTQQTDEAEKLLGVGESKSNGEIPAAERAAWTLVASTLFNLDETLTRE